MSTIKTISLTTLDRNTAVLRTATIDRKPMLLTQHGRVVLAVVNVERYAQLLKIAEQAAMLLRQPDLRQLGRVIAQFEDTSLLADPATLMAHLAELSDVLPDNQNT
jgi:hypothetical protein